MRSVGLLLLVIGFLWVLIDTQAGFVAYSYLSCVQHIKHLPEGDMVTRNDAGAAMRDLSLDLKNMHKAILMPVVLMFGGGLLTAFARRPKKVELHDSPDGDDATREPARR